MESPIIVALDFENEKATLALVKQLDPLLCRVKIGKTLFTRYGPSILEKIQHLGFDIFLDLKYHDIPHQVAGACRAAAELNVWMLTIHVAGGQAMMMAAREAVDAARGPAPKLMGITLLTSLGDEDLATLGYQGTVADYVSAAAASAKASGLDGVVCSAQEAQTLRKSIGRDFLLVTPGIRLPSSVQDDQKRVVTPKIALERGSSYLVIGRPITQASEPRVVLEQILKDIR